MVCHIDADQVQELELSVDMKSLDKLLEFLSCSFSGGTDVDRPLQLSLERLQKDEWAQVQKLHFCLCPFTVFCKAV